MTRFYTFEDKSVEQFLQYHAHVTLRFRNGCVAYRSREKVRSTGKRDVPCGTYNTVSGALRIRFSVNNEALRLAACAMFWHWDAIVTFSQGTWHRNEFTNTVVLESDGVTTNPDSIRGEGRGARTPKARNRRTTDGTQVGRKQAAQDMRAAILARQAARAK